MLATLARDSTRRPVTNVQVQVRGRVPPLFHHASYTLVVFALRRAPNMLADATLVVLVAVTLITATVRIRKDPDRLIWFESVTVDPAQAAQFDAEPYPTTVRNAASFTFIVELHSPSESEKRRLSSACNAISSGYVPHSSYLFYGSAQQMHCLRADRNVRWIGNLHPRFKTSLTLSRYAPVPGRTRFFSVPDLGAPLPQLVVSLTAPAPDAVERLRQLPGVSALDTISDVRVVLEVDEVAGVGEIVAEDPAVHWVERRLRHQFLNRWARSLILKTGANATADYKARTGLLSWDLGLDGAGQVVALGDSGLDKHSCFFASRHTCVKRSSRSRLFPVDDDVASSDKIVAYVAYADSEDATGHGTHLAGTIAGDPHLPDGARGTLPTFAGMAPAARLAIVDIGEDGIVRVPVDLRHDYFDPMYEVGARIMTSAWGAGAPLYTNEAADIDAYMSEHPDFLVITAAGNDGACNDEMTIVTPATSKNSVAVGATLSLSMQYRKTDLVPPGFDSATDPRLGPDSVAAFSSKGPTIDGRIKPDVVAPGYFVYSAASGVGSNRCDGELGAIVTPNAGTSTAAAVVAGAAALVRQYLMDGFYPGGRRNPRNGFEPSAALLKALLVHSARQVNGTRQVGDSGIADPPQCPRPAFVPLLADGVPNIDQGWGRPQLDQILSFPDDTLHVVGRNNRSAGTFGDPDIGPGQQHQYRFCLLESQTVVHVTLVWTDPPATLGAGLQLVNDLDLVVDVNIDALRYGNDADETSGDRRNPVERVELMTSRPLSDLTVSVHARRIVVGHTQPYALVVTGRGLRPGPCRPHYEMMSVAGQQHQNDDDPVLQGAVRLLNTARGLRSKLVASDSESLNGARLLSALIAFVLLDVLLW